MLPYKNMWVLLLLLTAFSCKKNVQPTKPKTGIYKMAGPRTWRGDIAIDTDYVYPYPHFDSFYEVSFSNVIYVLNENTIACASGFSLPSFIDTLYYDSLYTTEELIYFGSDASWNEARVRYYPISDSLDWRKGWMHNGDYYYQSVHTP